MTPTEILNDLAAIITASHEGHAKALMQATDDNSIIIEASIGGVHVCLELFQDGDAVYLKRKGKEKPEAYDFHLTLYPNQT